ncbi:GNAT family N-acetyltransferase [Gottfriedia luciferensis]|uniref:GNAT family N-acetyltransferase n=1 Tax=Gottfriedia luciferensis TaxID=178774 RepID=A0ABX2ZVX7_9BACI|nr:GNAT family N-acetyltransferase [Gottfriedia luciferensis]ODG93900.1 GNAT family N-acetyltransferase [Gottfriedia luciferensis]
MEIKYRIASTNDSSEIARLSGQLGYNVEKDQVIERLNKILGQNDHVVIVAEIEGQLIGWIHAHGRYLIESPPYVEIGGLIVDSTYRGQKIGKLLVERCEEWSKLSGFKEIRVRTNETRIETLIFYEKIGFKNTKSQKVFNKELIVY